MPIPTGTIELKKYALRQNRDGTVVSFVVHPSDCPAWLSSDPIGTVYAAALVEVDSGGQPQQPPPDKPPPEKSGGGEHRSWDNLPYPAQTGIRCQDPTFLKFLRTITAVRADEESADVIRRLCRIASRSDLIHDTPAGDRWHSLDLEFQNYLQGRSP